MLWSQTSGWQSIAKSGNRLSLNPSEVFQQLPIRQRRVFNRLSELCPELCEMEVEGGIVSE